VGVVPQNGGLGTNTQARDRTVDSISRILNRLLVPQVAASRGVEGVSGLLRTLCDEVKENESWSEPLTSEFVAVRDRLDELRFRDKLVDIKYEEFVDIVLSCGVQVTNFGLAFSPMNLSPFPVFAL
jgi:hypothetical protein